MVKNSALWDANTFVNPIKLEKFLNCLKKIALDEEIFIRKYCVGDFSILNNFSGKTGKKNFFVFLKFSHNYKLKKKSFLRKN